VVRNDSRYLAAEAFRHKVAQSADAPANIQNAIAAIDILSM